MYHKQMLDSELLNLFNAIKSYTKVEDFNPAQNQILVECVKRNLVTDEETK
jgi:hypothetical protein